MEERIDVNYWRTSEAFGQLYANPNFPLAPLRELVELVQYGISERATVEPVGTPILRMNNLQAEGWDLTNLKYVELDDAVKERFLLEPGDLLFNRTNSKELVGKCDVFSEQGEWVFASYLVRARLDRSRALPTFVSDFLNTSAGRVQIDRVSRQIIGMLNVNAEELQNLLIPLPPIETQQTLVAEMDAARASRKQKLAQADELLNSLDRWLLEQLGLTTPQVDNRKTFAVPLRATLQSGRLNAEYFHPERTLAIQTMQEQSTHLDSAPLTDVVNFVRDVRKSPGEARYVGLAHVQGNTGELVDATENASGNCLAFQTSDVLFGRLRPYLNKVYCAEFAGVCSPEFHVMRIIETELLDPEYLAVILRSSLILAQTHHMMTGNTRPRLTNEDVINLVVPIPDKNLQATIVDEVQHRRVGARRLRAEAETEWEAAKQHFETQLLGGE